MCCESNVLLGRKQRKKSEQPETADLQLGQNDFYDLKYLQNNKDGNGRVSINLIT